MFLYRAADKSLTKSPSTSPTGCHLRHSFHLFKYKPALTHDIKTGFKYTQNLNRYY